MMQEDQRLVEQCEAGVRTLGGVDAVMIYAVFTLFLKVPLPVGLLFK